MAALFISLSNPLEDTSSVGEMVTSPRIGYALLAQSYRLIKQAVLESAAKNTNLPPDNIAKALCRAFTFIDLYGQ